MINKETYTKEHLLDIMKSQKVDPQILERAIYALGLLEAIRKVTDSFCFKGGSSLMLLTKKPRRLSTDIDIMVNPDFDIDSVVEKASKIFPFIRYEESERKSNKNISKKHYRFFYNSLLRAGKEVNILLDVLFTDLEYSSSIETEINNDLLLTDGDNLKVMTPSIEALLGDKLTAFAPHTVGIKFHNEDFSNDKRLEVVKQLLDISKLFELSNDFNVIVSNYLSVCDEEIKYRELDITYKECLMDTFNTALALVSRGAYYTDDYKMLTEGVSAAINHVFGEKYNGEKAVDDAANAMLLVSGILTNTDVLNLGIENQPLITNPKYNKVNFQRKINIDAFNKVAYAISLMENHKLI